MAQQDDPTLREAIEESIADRMFGTRTAMLCRVVSYTDTPRPMVTVQVAANKWKRQGSEIVFTPESQLQNVPVMELAWGPFVIRANLEQGDHGVLLIADRDIDGWLLKQGGDLEGRYDPGIALIHDINDALFLPAIQPDSKAQLPKLSNRQLVIGDREGIVSVTFDESASAIDIKAAIEVNIDSPKVTIGSTGAVAPIARVGVDVVVVPAGGAGGTFPITAVTTPSAHEVIG